ncbi:MAG: site-specific DNA-methyltransferase [Firmicutes bacterium]|nr:site-specific DNA-methyltransferase [Bacillota bacterium]
MRNEHALKKLQSLFRELFQFDFADLDFGLYRLFHLKRAEIEAFISEQLPREVDAVFEAITGEEQERLQAELTTLTQQVREQITEDAILPTGEVNPQYSGIKLVKQYAELRNKLADITAIEAYKAEVFNHLYNFFSRYYEDGDFIPKRRYGVRETYAVTYNGEEVFFTWANRDQHYVKTAETFKDYAFKVSGLTGEYRVRFTMAEANTPKDNTKGNTRYFFSRVDLLTCNAEARELILPFEYRLPTSEEAERYGPNSKAQEAILQEALPKILEAVPDANIRALLAADQRSEKDKEEGKPELPLLLKRLRHFCRRNTSDYFIHKNLRSFLTRELEFYVKDQIIHLMDLEADLEAKRRVMRTFRKLAEKVIDFLATIEDAQKTLFEKKKFVLETNYLIPIRHVPRDFWPEILQNEGQLEEWRRWLALEPEKDLFNPTGEVNEAFLEAHPTLPVHTRHFDRSFVRCLLEALPFNDLDEATDGLLVHGENYQALRLLLQRYQEQIKCIYIDPPYNTGNDEFIYKDRYQHSSWLAMMEERLEVAKDLLRKDGVLFSSIDFNEIDKLKILLTNVFGEGNFEGIITWRRRHNQPNDRTKMIGLVSEYLLAFSIDSISLKRAGVGKLDVTGKFSNPDNDPRGPWASKPWKVGSGQSGTRYKIVTPTGRVYEEEWMGDEETFKKLLEEGRIIFPKKGNGLPRKKYFKFEREEEGQCATNWWDHTQFGNNASATQMMHDLFDTKAIFDNPKPVELIRGCILISGKYVDNVNVLDFFAGSGTTGHAIINLNREDGGRRRFILVEMADYFDTVLLPRIVKVMYTPEWKEGKPKREATHEEAKRTPRLIKILRLESYEDALHNLAAPSILERSEKREKAVKPLAGEDAYRLRYWIEIPLQEAETCLRTLDLCHPFHYSLEVLTDEGPVRKPVDVVETFNYLYGLRVRRYETWEHNGRAYRVVKARDREGKRHILVIWRDMDSLNIEAERAFLEGKIAKMAADGEIWDEILINGDTPVPGVRSLDPLFKSLMMQGEEG